MKGKTIKLFLEEGSVYQIMSAEISNFTGSVLTVPRSQLNKLIDRQELKKTGIYILAGDCYTYPYQTSVYIGRSENLYNRLKQHCDESKNFWDRAALIYSKDRNLTQSHIYYLENKLIKLAINSNSTYLTNIQTGELPNLPKSDIADMESFLEQVKLLLPVVGFNYFEVTPKSTNTLFYKQIKSAETEDSPVFYMNAFNTNAYARRIEGKFVVLKDSIARKISIDSFADTYKKLRIRLIAEGKLSYDPLRSKLIFTQDVSFKSSTAAAAVISGGNISGRTAFKIKDTNVTYGEWEQRRTVDANRGKLKVLNSVN